MTALGCFDGVHRGHRSLLLAAKTAAGERSLPFTVWSLTGKPARGGGAAALLCPSVLLCTEETRRQLLQEEIGADRVILAPFDAVRSLSCEEFVRDILRRELRTEIAVCGENFRFGKGGAGDAAALRTLMRKWGGDALTLPLLREAPGDASAADSSAGEAVSSTKIKALLEAGDPASASLLLGRPFFIEGEVCRGKALGRTLGFPTANLPFPPSLVRPKFGVYFARVILPSGKHYAAVCNLGLRPTVEDRLGLLLECCLLGFDGCLYGQRLRAELLDFLRPEQRFASKEALQAQVLADLAAGRRMAAAFDL